MSHFVTKDTCHVRNVKGNCHTQEIRSFVTPHNAQNIQTPVVNIQTLPDRELRSVVKLGH